MPCPYTCLGEGGDCFGGQIASRAPDIVPWRQATFSQNGAERRRGVLPYARPSRASPIVAPWGARASRYTASLCEAAQGPASFVPRIVPRPSPPTYTEQHVTRPAPAPHLCILCIVPHCFASEPQASVADPRAMRRGGFRERRDSWAGDGLQNTDHFALGRLRVSEGTTTSPRAVPPGRYNLACHAQTEDARGPVG
jgi:hypothetical protein